MKSFWIVLLLSGCVTDCRPWIPSNPDDLEPVQVNGHTLVDEIPDLSLGMKCRY